MPLGYVPTGNYRQGPAPTQPAQAAQQPAPPAPSPADDAAVLAQFQGMQMNADPKQDNCAVCRNPLSQERVVQFPCSHQLHVKCAAEWARVHRPASCPICRAPFVLVQNCVIL